MTKPSQKPPAPADRSKVVAAMRAHRAKVVANGYRPASGSIGEGLTECVDQDSLTEAMSVDVFIAKHLN